MKFCNLKAKYYALECSDKNTISSTVTLLLSTVYPNWNASGFRARPISLLNIHNRATYKGTWILSTISACIYLSDGFISSLPLKFDLSELLIVLARL